MRDEFALIPLHLDSITHDTVANVLGFTPSTAKLRRFLESKGYYMVSGGVFKRPSAIVRKSGRLPTDDEKSESRHTSFHRGGGKLTDEA